jgi:hypothetical protein
MRFLLIILFFSLFSCGESKKQELNLNHTAVDSFAIRQNPFVDKALILLKSRTFDADSMGTSNYQILFKNGKDRIAVFETAITFDHPEGGWNANFDIFVDEITGMADSRFLILSHGFDAHGYPLRSFMFFLGDKPELVVSWTSVGDSGFGTWREFFPTFEGTLVQEFRHRTLFTEPADEGMVDISFADSTLVQYRGGKWMSRMLTSPAKPYRIETLTETEYFR